MMSPIHRFDLTVIGGGIIGLATARQALLKHPKLRICIVEKDDALAQHQSKRNSGVVHQGVYYRRGSLRSKFCIKGARLMQDYCREKNLPFIQCGKLIVATKQEQLETLHKLFNNAKANDVAGIELVSKDRAENIQPGCNKTLEAIWSPQTSIVDWHQVALSYANDFEQLGGKIIKNFLVCKLDATESDTGEHEVKLFNLNQKEDYLTSKAVVNCAGLFSDLVARQTGNDEHPKVVPFKGNYLMLSNRLAGTIKTNIYPVPNPKLPFLGVHITPRIDGSVLVGPTSLLTLGYERYSDSIPINLAHLYHIYVRSGLRKLVLKEGNIRAGIEEILRFQFKSRIVKEVQELLPGLTDEDLIDTKFNGIRAQAVSKHGDLVDDFLFETGVWPKYERVLHVRNCPSPAATSSLSIAERVVDILEERFL